MVTVPSLLPYPVRLKEGEEPLAAPATGDATEATLQRIDRRLGLPLITEENMAVGEVTTGSVRVGESIDAFILLLSLDGKALPPCHFALTQIEIATELAATDAVRLRLFRSEVRRVPQDLQAEFDGASQISGTWVASFSNRRIEYTDSSNANKVWLEVRNTTGNSRTGAFQVRIYGRPLPMKVN
jgi:hypothetical protein